MGVVFNLAMHAPKHLEKITRGEKVDPATKSQMDLSKKWWGTPDEVEANGHHD